MARNYRPREMMKYMKAKQTAALRRDELRVPSERRKPSAGVTSLAIKDEDPETRRMIDEFLAKRR